MLPRKLCHRATCAVRINLKENFQKMSPLLIKISKDFATLWTTIDPIGNVALFAGLTAALTRADRHWTALRACIYATIILVVAMTAGQVIETRSLPTL